jgi:ribosomal protein S18 acetylase RimI-like enzyme
MKTTCFAPVLAATDDAVAALHPLLVQLRPHLATAADLVEAWRNQQSQGYRLVFAAISNRPAVAAGFRIGHNLRFGRFLYVDDLVTDDQWRGQRYGERMLGHLKQVAAQEKCRALLLDTPMSNSRAHRFYFRNGLSATALRFTHQV